MRLWDGIALAGMQLTRRRLRAFLCALSVGVGVASMLLIAALGACGQREVRTRIDSLGLSGLTVYVSEAAAGQKLTQKYAALLEQNLPEITHAMALKAKTGIYRTSHTSGNAIFFGVTEELGEVMDLKIVAGNLPAAQQVQNGEPVAVIDESLAQTLYGRGNVIGKRIRFAIDGTEQSYRISAVISQQSGAFGSMLGGLVPTIVYVPYACLADPQDSADQIMVQCMAGADPAATGEKIVDYLSIRGQVAGKLSVQDMGGALGQIEGAVSIATALFLAVAAISFFVAMLGVFSGMLSAAHEKKAEIGLFMALGARKRDIARLFLAQSVLVGLTGGAGGVLFSALLLAFLEAATGFPLSAPPVFALCVLVLSALCGALAGAAPAMHAAGLRPVEAMRK